MKWLAIAVGISLWGLTACGTHNACTAGVSSACTCANGQSGTQTCTADNTVGTCVCGGGSSSGSSGSGTTSTASSSSGSSTSRGSSGSSSGGGTCAPPCSASEGCANVDAGVYVCLTLQPDGGLCPYWPPLGCGAEEHCTCNDGTIAGAGCSGPPSCNDACCGHLGSDAG